MRLIPLWLKRYPDLPKLLRKDSQSEVEIIRDILGKDVPFFGCYVCGEYVPIDIHEYTGQSCFHNQAISIALFSE